MSRSFARDVVHDAVADADGALGDLLEAGDHSERGRLPATRGADEHHELAVGDLERHLAHGLGAVRVDLAHTLEVDLGHALLSAGW